MTSATPLPTLSQAAGDFVGSRFRLHGRDPATGIDCVGLCLAALHRCGCNVDLPIGYGLRNITVDRMISAAARQGSLEPCSGSVGEDEVVLVQIDPMHFHLLISAPGERFVHAHAGLRRVVWHYGGLPGKLLRHWRVASINLLLDQGV